MLIKKFAIIYFFFSAIFLFCNGCSNAINSLYKQGDIVSFKADSNRYGAALIIEITKEKSGALYWVCFTDFFDTIPLKNFDIKRLKLSGRKISSGIDPKGYEVALDISYISDSIIDSKSKLTGRVSLSNKKLKFGSQGFLTDYNELLFTYKMGMKRREFPPDHYNDFMKKIGSEFRPEEYFSILDYIKEN